MATSSPSPPYRGTVREQSLYIFGGIVAVMHICIPYAMLILSGMLPLDICGSAGIHSKTYWMVLGQAGLTGIAGLFFGALLFLTLWKTAYYLSLAFSAGFAGFHVYVTVFYIEIQNACGDHTECWGGCSAAPNPPMTGWFITWWTLTGVLALLSVLEVLLVTALSRYTATQGALWWAYGPNAGPWNYYERFRSDWASPWGVPQGAPVAAPIGAAATSTFYPQQQEASNALGAKAPLLGRSVGRPINALDIEIERARKLPPGSSIAGGLAGTPCDPLSQL